MTNDSQRAEYTQHSENTTGESLNVPNQFEFESTRLSQFHELSTVGSFQTPYTPQNEPSNGWAFPTEHLNFSNTRKNSDEVENQSDLNTDLSNTRQYSDEVENQSDSNTNHHSNNLFQNTTTDSMSYSRGNDEASSCLADISDVLADISSVLEKSNDTIKSPARKKTKTSKAKSRAAHGLKRPMPSANAANATLENPLEINLVGNPSKKSLVKNQKDGYSLYITSDDSLRKLTIASRGILKSGAIRWICSDRSCKAACKTSLNKSFIEAFHKTDKTGKEQSRVSFRIKEDVSLKLEDLNLIISSRHTCIGVDKKIEIKEKITAKAKSLCEEIKIDTIRRPTRAEIVDKALTEVLSNYGDIDKLGFKRTNIPRCVSRKLLKVLPLLPEINENNQESFVFPDTFSAGNYPIDLEYCRETSNKRILFSNHEILLKLTTGQASLVCDSTFPLKRGSLFLQLWILLKTDLDSTEIAAAVWMTDKKKTSYTDILSRLQFLAGKQLWVKSIVTDGEVGQANSLYENIKHSEKCKCSFHATNAMLRLFKKYGLGKFLPNKNKQTHGPVAKLITHVWQCAQLLPYFPVQLTLAFLDFLAEDSAPTISERMKATQNWLDSYHLSNKVFSNESCRKPAKKTLERRNDILDILKEIQNALHQTDYENLLKIDNMVYDMHCMSNELYSDSENEYDITAMSDSEDDSDWNETDSRLSDE